MTLTYTADRVQETTTTTGTGTLSLAGAVVQYQSFVSGIGNGKACYYCILGGNGTDWEVGIGTVTSGSPNILSRATILSSSNSGAGISLTGTSTVFATLPAVLANNAYWDNTFTDSISAAGTTQGTATVLTTRMNVVTTVSSGTGVQLTYVANGLEQVILNKGANVLNLYPQTAAQIDAAGTNTAVTIAVGASATVMSPNSTVWRSR